MIDITIIPRAEIPGLIIALAARLSEPVPAPASGATPSDGEDRMLTTAEAAVMVGHSTKWIYRHLRDLPFARRIGTRYLRFSLHGLRVWQARQKVR
jgi:predicted DNA-binding transcriptional regulator AlpA